MKAMKLTSTLYLDHTSNGVRIMRDFLFRRAVEERDGEITDELRAILKENNLDKIKSKIREMVISINRSQY